MYFNKCVNDCVFNYLLHYLIFGDGWIRLPDDFDRPEFATVTIQRDLFYGYDTLMENVSDPSHIDFAHHKVEYSPISVSRFLT